ncbi:MAG: PIG-L family deacetylase [Firmicutes bacterium]|nr:PIG-L family deacetylase [Bacillota bacterium]MCM1402168.1 PIG-L family deacetylase [Bacteroides sp.]MCM1476686.1 PIG-L family deacetylase [Bacteroides sp.]
MKTNLSSQIKLEQIPSRYYDPQGEVELTALTREEKVYTRIFETVNQGSVYIAKNIVKYIKRNVAEKGKCVLALGAGMNTHSVYAELIKLYEQGQVSFKKVVVFSIGEFFPLVANGPCTLNMLKEVFLNHVDIAAENIRTFDPSVTKEDMYECCKAYERQIASEGGIDICVCEVGAVGSLAFNEPGSPATSLCRLVLLGSEARHKIAGDYKCDEVPTTAITLGIGNILSARRILTMAWGENAAHIVKKTVEGPTDVAVPASFLQGHPQAKVVVDLPAAEELTRISRPWLVTSCDWNDKLIRRAIVWLCHKTNKPILKLTDKDYRDFGLGELLALYGSAYNVNIKIFNDLQHTITGWPGGKPDADDTYRPERAKPYPKRVIVFSPHPDDDVISMGGTLKRLVDQKHDVHVAYETSGNIAVGDEDMIRYVMLMDQIADKFGFNTEDFRKKSKEIHEFIDKKVSGEVDLPDIRFLKTMIRRGEARIACNYIGVKPENVHFLNLPFYETGTIKKGDLSEADINIVKDLIESVKPQQIFVAGDLADPHGTHRVCTDAVLAAIDDLKSEPWMADCRIWMYRGAWAEWEIDHIEMAVPISPEELRFKRNSILKHQSQMENAPFLGDDDRLFWQRAEDRNRATAQLYESLGLASYEAMEAFVQYHPL